MIDVIWKGAAGGLVTALIVLAGRRGNTLPGILTLFPTFTIIALIFASTKGEGAMRETCLAGIKTVPAFLAFGGVCYAMLGRVDYRIAVVTGLAAWFATALAIFWLPSRLG